MGKHLAADERASTSRRPSLGRLILLAFGIGLIAGAFTIFVVSVIQHKSMITVLMQSAAPTPQQLFGKDRILMLVVGRDYDYDEKDQETSKASRSDVIQVFSLDFVNHRINELSVPRDMDVILPNGHEAKINQALSDGGVPEAEAVIAKFLEVPPFDTWVALRINSAKSVIDAIGGVDIVVKEQLDYDDSWGHLHIHFKPGKYHMNGEQAVSYARFRHDWCGDPCRIKRQQQVIHAIADKLKNNKLNDLAHAATLIDIIRKNVDTNMTATQLTSLAAAFSDIDPKTIVTDQVPYVDTKDTAMAGNVLIPDENAKRRLVQKLLLEPPAPVASPDAGALAAIAPATVKVDVKNGTGIAGTARKVADALRAKGFAIGDVGNADRSDYDATEIHEHTLVTFAGAKVRSALTPRFQHTPIVTDASPSPAPKSDVTVIVGKDFLSAVKPQASIP